MQKVKTGVWKIKFSTIFLCAKKVHRVLNARGVASDRWIGEKEVVLWEPLEPCGSCGNLGGNKRQHHPLLANNKEQTLTGWKRDSLGWYSSTPFPDIVETYMFSCLCAKPWSFRSFTSFLPVEVVGVASPSSIGPLGILLGPRTMMKWNDGGR